MRTADRTPAAAWAVLAILVCSSALAVLAAQVSGPLAMGVGLGGAVTAMLFAWATQPAAGTAERAAAPGRDEHPKAA